MATRTYNIFSKKYWTRENLIDTKEMADLKQAWNEVGKKDDDTKEDMGKKISRIGWKLTVGITVPMILTALFGVLGFIVGAIIFIFTIKGLKK